MKFLPIMLCALLLVGCSGSGADSYSMPADAKNFQDQGNDWFSFEWKGQCFLAKESSESFANNYDYAITKVNCE